MSSKFRFLTPLSLWLRISAIPSGEWRTALASCPPSTPSNSLSRNSSSPRLSSSSSDSVTSAIAKAVGFLLSSLKCGNNTSRPRCTQYRFHPFFYQVLWFPHFRFDCGSDDVSFSYFYFFFRSDRLIFCLNAIISKSSLRRFNTWDLRFINSDHRVFDFVGNTH